jgi:DNA-binding transcriptional regulator YdaS (Cro superfamily)
MARVQNLFFITTRKKALDTNRACVQIAVMTLHAYLEFYGITNVAFADKINVASSTVGRIRKGEVIASVETAKAIHAATRGKVSKHELRPDVWAKRDVMDKSGK